MVALEQAKERKEAAAVADTPRSEDKDKKEAKSGAEEKAKEVGELDVQLEINRNRINSFQELNWKDPFPDPEPPKAKSKQS